MKKFTYLLLCAALLFNPCFSRADNFLVIVNGKLVQAEAIVDPKVEIVGDETPIELGEFATLNVKVEDSAKSFIKETKTNWKITQNGSPKRFFIDFQGNPVVMAGIQNGVKIDVEADTQITYGVEEKTFIKNVLSKGILKVGDDKPTPPPKPPDPTPTPTPVNVPDGFIGATKANYNLLKSTTTSFAQMDKKVVKEGKEALKNNFYQVAAKLSAGAISGENLEEYLKNTLTELQQLNKSDLKIQLINSGLQDYGAAIRKYMFENYKSEKLKTTGDWADLFRALGDSFDYD